MGALMALALTVLCCGPPAPAAPEPAVTVTVLEPEPGLPTVDLSTSNALVPVATEHPALPAAPTVEHLIRAAAARYGVSAATMLRISKCESGLRPWVTSPGGHMGLFQFSRQTWRWASVAAGYGGASPYSAEASAFSAAWLMSQSSGLSHWSCR
jgi:hypothetical protein